MKTLVKTKLLDKDHIELREHELFKEPLRVVLCSSEDYKNCSHEECKFMFLSVAQQNKGKITNTQQSKFPPYSYYRMFKFKWSPVKENLDKELSVDTSVMQRLGKEFRRKYT